MTFLSPIPSFGSLSAERYGFEGLGVKTAQAFPIYALPKINQDRDLTWAYLLPQCLLALVSLWGWSLVVVVTGAGG